MPRLTEDEMRECWREVLCAKYGQVKWLYRMWQENPAKAINSNHRINVWLEENHDRYGGEE